VLRLVLHEPAVFDAIHRVVAPQLALVTASSSGGNIERLRSFSASEPATGRRRTSTWSAAHRVEPADPRWVEGVSDPEGGQGPRSFVSAECKATGSPT
jgi:hypothetical protein